MSEWRFFEGDVPYVSTAEFHADRGRAPHLEQAHHRPRLLRAAELAVMAMATMGRTGTVSDLGCGDGGLLSLLHTRYGLECWGYDFAPANMVGWIERGVSAQQMDVFGADRDKIEFGDVTVVTEVLEHIADPHGAVRWIGEHSPWIVASSPHTEGPWGHDECHAWAWDPDGYRALIEQGGYEIVEHNGLTPFQIILARRTP